MRKMREIFDMHMHLGFALEPPALARALEEAGVIAFANTITPFEYQELRGTCPGFDELRLGLGLHPWQLESDESERNRELLEAFLNDLTDARAIGEIGLDFSSKHEATKAEQLKVFSRVIEACSGKGDLLLSVHAVKAEDALLDILESFEIMRDSKVILHSYAGSSDQLKRAIDDGCLFSIGRRMLSTKRGREYARIIPADRLLVESDLPSFMGQEVDAGFIRDDLDETLSELARIRGAQPDALLRGINERSRALLDPQHRP